MAVLTAAMLMAWAILVMAGNTPIGRGLRNLIVNAPAARLSRNGTGSLLLALLLALVAATAAWLLEEESIRLAAMAAPEVALWLSTFEVATLLDVAVAVLAAASTLRPRALLSRLRAIRPRAPRPRAAQRPEQRAANDEEDSAPALAA